MSGDSQSGMHQHVLPVRGMTCQKCVAAVTGALTAVDGVRTANVSLDAESAVVAADANVTQESLAAAVRDAGFSTEPHAPSPLVSIGRPAARNHANAEGPSHPGRPGANPEPTDAEKELSVPKGDDVIRLDIDGMHCAACVARVEQQLSSVPQVRSAAVSLTPGRAAITLDGDVDSAALIAAVAAAGYEARAAGAMRDAFAPLDADAQRWLFRTAIAGVCLLCFALPAVPGAPWLMPAVRLVAATIAMGVTGRPFLIGAIRQAMHRSVNMDTLVAASTTVAYLAGAWSVIGMLPGPLNWLPALSHSMALMDAVMILGFISFGKWLEAKTRTQATRSLQDLLQLAPERAIVLRNRQSVEVLAEAVLPGETIVIGPGEKAPLDGIVSEGQSAVDESWLTGESVPVRKQPGDPIWAGSINGSGGLQVLVERPAGESWVARIVQQVEATLESKAPIQRLADQAASWFTPIVFSIAGISAFGWWLADAPDVALRTLVTVLIVACPCALGLATPIAIVVATATAAKDGLLFRHAESLETLGRVRQFVFDKTGTLTEGKLAVQEIIANDGAMNTSLPMAAAVLQSSSHPVARAVVSYVLERVPVGPTEETNNPTPALPAAEQVEETPGDGVVGIVAGHRVMAGNRRWLEEHGVRWPESPGIVGASDDSRRPDRTGQVEISIDGHWAGGVVLADEPRTEAADVIQQLQGLGIQVRLLSGDAEERVADVAQQVGVSDYVAGARPDDKLNAIRRWQESGLVAMVGDGMNDGPSLSAADVGIAMGKGADISVEAADLVLSHGALHGLPTAWRLSHRTIRIIRQNLLWAVIYNVLLIPWAAGWLAGTGLPPLPPSAAAAAMALSSVTVVANSLRLRGRKEVAESADSR